MLASNKRCKFPPLDLVGFRHHQTIGSDRISSEVGSSGVAFVLATISLPFCALKSGQQVGLWSHWNYRLQFHRQLQNRGTLAGPEVDDEHGFAIGKLQGIVTQMQMP